MSVGVGVGLLGGGSSLSSVSSSCVLSLFMFVVTHRVYIQNDSVHIFLGTYSV